MNLSAQEKKLFSRIGIILGGLAIVAFSYWGFMTIIKDFRNDKENEKKELVRKYESKIDSINTVNYMLALQADSLKKQVAIEQGKKRTVYIETVRKEKEIKDATAAEHALAIDTLTGQPQTWSVIKDTITQDTLIHYKFTKPGITKLRLTVNDLYKYKKLYSIDEVVIAKQIAQLGIQETMLANNKIAIDNGEKALGISTESNEKLTKQLNRAEKRAGRWPYWAGAGFIGGVILCLSIQ